MANVIRVDPDNFSEGHWSAVELLFQDLHEHMSESGLLMPLVKGGANMWRTGAQKSLARFGCLVVAQDGDVILGFGHGSMKLAPAHLGGDAIGSINYFYLKSDLRGAGIGRGMMDALMDWFGEKNVKSVELEVTAGNLIGQGFWSAQGFEKELIQYRKKL